MRALGSRLQLYSKALARAGGRPVQALRAPVVVAVDTRSDTAVIGSALTSDQMVQLAPGRQAGRTVGGEKDYSIQQKEKFPCTMLQHFFQISLFDISRRIRDTELIQPFV